MSTKRSSVDLHRRSASSAAAQPPAGSPVEPAGMEQHDTGWEPTAFERIEEIHDTAKKWWQSKALWGALTVAVGLLSKVTGWEIPLGQIRETGDILLSGDILTQIGAALGIWGLRTAKKNIG